MKILRLKFKNINSLKGEHEIDFTDAHFTQNPLFAITGPTGSGKTTILDVLTLALFGEVPRLGKISKKSVEESGAILTRGQKDAYAQVDYECKSGIYSSVWSIGINRNGNLNDYEMDLARIDLPENLDLTKSQIPRKNEELIGLNYSQFAKSVMLAQGQFAEFLKADRKERSEILEKITGTSIYKQLGRLAFEKFRDKNKSIEEQVSILNSEKEKLLEEEERKKIVSQLKVLLEEKSRVEKVHKKTEKQLELQLEIQGLTKTLDKRLKSLEISQKEEFDFEERYGETVKNHENVQRFSENLHQWKYKQKEVTSLAKEAERLSGEKAQQQKQNEIQFGEIQTFIGKNIEENDVLNELEIFREQVGTLIKQKDQLGHSYKEHRALFKGALSGMDFEESINDLLKRESFWEEVLNRHKNKGEDLKTFFKNSFPEDISKVIEQKEEESDLLKKAQTDQANILRIGKEVNRKSDQLEVIADQLKPLPEEIKHLNSQQALAAEKVKGLRLEQKLNLMKAELESYRRELESGKPCPLCGSKEHPYAENQPLKENDLANQIEKGEIEERKLSNQLSRKSAQQEELNKQQKSLGKELKIQSVELRKLEGYFNHSHPGKIEFEEKDWENNLKLNREYIKKLNHLKEFYQENEAIKKAIPLHSRLQEITRKGRQVNGKIESFYTGKNLEKDIRGLENTWQGSLQKLTALKERIKETIDKSKKEQDNFIKIEGVLLPQLQSVGFTDINRAEAALLSSDRYESLKKQMTGIKEEIKVLQTEIKTHQERKDQLLAKLTTEKGSEELKNILTELKKNIEEFQQKEQEYGRLLKNDEELIKRIEKLREKIKNAQVKMLRWRLLRDLIGDSNGHKFNQFAQDLTLRQLLILANKRLQEISERYRLVLQPISNSNKDTLVIADMDMGGQERAVQTLSGGESFLVSLALALGLSDLASKNISINSLFIDEGFGTLDGNTLDQTLDVLERLQASSSKLIGIISHVDSLKERIGTQIQLKQDGQGYSSLKIV